MPADSRIPKGGEMFKKVILVTLLVLVFVCAIQFTRQSILNNPQKIYDSILPEYKYLADLSPKDKVYAPQRNLTYALTYMNLVPLGKVGMSAEKAGRRVSLKAAVETTEVVKKLYKVDLQVESLIDKDTFYPLKYTEIINLPDRKKIKEIVYDQDNNTMERKGKKYKIPPSTLCPISAFYYLQTEDFKLGRKHKLTIVSKEDVYFLKMETVEETGNILKLKGSVRRRNLSSTHGTDFTLWISEDLRIPLLFKVTTEAGSITARALVKNKKGVRVIFLDR